MHPGQVLIHLRRRPFRPFRVHISDGSQYDVHHPENAVVTRTDIAIAIEPLEDDLPQRLIHCDPLHITRIEPLPEKNGRKRPKR